MMVYNLLKTFVRNLRSKMLLNQETKKKRFKESVKKFISHQALSAFKRQF
jgi:hypothetical protein